MAGQSIQKRKFHAFLSHAHADKPAVDRLFHWLADVSGVPVWYDGRNLPAGATIVSALPQAIDQCRAVLLVVSKASIESGWVTKEYEYAEFQRSQHRDFRIIPVRLEDYEVPGFLRTTKWIDLPQGAGELQAYGELLADLYYEEVDLDLDRLRDVYVSRGWGEGEESRFADRICRALIDKDFRLIGDARDQKVFDEARVKGIMSSCGGYAAILPHRGDGATSSHILREIRIAQTIGVPLLIVAEAEVRLPEEIAASALRLKRTDVLDAASADSALRDRIEVLNEEWREPLRPHYVFYGTDFAAQNKTRNQLVKQILQRVTAMKCYLGDEIREGQIQQIISDRISSASVVIADISEENLNTCIEAGIARGAKTRFHLVAREPRRRPPFMFRDQQVWYYSEDVELLGTVHRIAYPYRRRVLNWELPN